MEYKITFTEIKKAIKQREKNGATPPHVMMIKKSDNAVSFIIGNTAEEIYVKCMRLGYFRT